MIRNIDRTQWLMRPTWENPRIHLLDDVWLLTIVALLIATGLPWFASDFEVDIGAASLGLLALRGDARGLHLPRRIESAARTLA